MMETIFSGLSLWPESPSYIFSREHTSHSSVSGSKGMWHHMAQRCLVVHESLLNCCCLFTSPTVHTQPLHAATSTFALFIVSLLLFFRREETSCIFQSQHICLLSLSCRLMCAARSSQPSSPPKATDSFIQRPFYLVKAATPFCLRTLIEKYWTNSQWVSQSTDYGCTVALPNSSRQWGLSYYRFWSRRNANGPCCERFAAYVAQMTLL